MIICDTGPLVAAALSNDADHAACVRLFNDMHAAGRDLLVPATVTAEVGYLLALAKPEHASNRSSSAPSLKPISQPWT